jgi:chromosome condensin MukBEF ATPase and DNA-binding subunit MukB
MRSKAMTDEELRQLIAGNSRAIAELTAVVATDHLTTAENTQAIAENTQAIQAMSRDIAQLVATQQEAVQDRAELRFSQEQTNTNLDRLTHLTERYINASTAVVERLDRGMGELRTGQEQQARVLDYLLHKEQERQNGEQGG